MIGTKLPLRNPPIYTPKNTPFLTPKMALFRTESMHLGGTERPCFGVILGVKKGSKTTPHRPPQTTPLRPPGDPPGGPPPARARAGPRGPPGRKFRKFPDFAKIGKNALFWRFALCWSGTPKNPLFWPFWTPTGWRGFPPPHHPPLTPIGDRRFDKRLHVALLRHGRPLIGPETTSQDDATWEHHPRRSLKRHRARPPLRRAMQRDSFNDRTIGCKASEPQGGLTLSAGQFFGLTRDSVGSIATSRSQCTDRRSRLADVLKRASHRGTAGYASRGGRLVRA